MNRTRAIQMLLGTHIIKQIVARQIVNESHYGGIISAQKKI
jgi:hypothetical protein